MTDKTVTITLTDGTAMEVSPTTPVASDRTGRGLLGYAVVMQAEKTRATTVYEPMRQFWTPYEPWMRDVLAEDARVSWVTVFDHEHRHAWVDLDEGMSDRPATWGVRVHPDDVPERPDSMSTNRTEGRATTGTEVGVLHAIHSQLERIANTLGAQGRTPAQIRVHLDGRDFEGHVQRAEQDRRTR